MGAHPEVVAVIRSSMASVVSAAGQLRSLLTPPEPPVEITDEQVTQPKPLARLVTTIVAAISRLERRPNPRRIDYEDIEVLHSFSESIDVGLVSDLNARNI